MLSRISNGKNLTDILKHRAKHGKLSPTRVIVISFLVVVLCGTLLLMLPFSTTTPGGIPFVDALFTATSATCVTGLVVFDTFTGFTLFGQVVIIFLIQIGGLGLVTLTTFFSLALGKRLGFKSLKLATESVNFDNALAAKKIVYTVMKITFTFEAIGAILLIPAFFSTFGLRAIWISVFTSISAFCNAGFDLFGILEPYSSLMLFADSWYILTIVMLLIVFGGLGFIVWSDILNFKTARKLLLHTRIVIFMTVALIITGTLAFLTIEWNNPATMGNMSNEQKLLSSLFQSVTCRTAGFNSIDLTALNPLSKVISIFLMFIGAAPGGTGGGIKITTFAIIAMTVIGVVRGREDPIISGKRIGKQTVYKSMSIISIAMLVVLITTLIFTFDTPAGTSILDCAFEAVSAFGTVGLSVGVTSVMGEAAKVATIITMLVGRVGPIAMAMTFSMTTSGQSKRAVLPDAKIIVG